MLKNVSRSESTEENIINLLKRILDRNRFAKRIVIEASEPYLFKISDSIGSLKDELGDSGRDIEIIINGTPRYGSCDIDIQYYQYLKPDLVIHIGHTPFPHSFKKLRIQKTKFYFIPVFDDVNISDELASQVFKYVEDLKADHINIVYSIQYKKAAESLLKLLLHRGYNVKMPRLPGMIQGQILGCLNHQLQISNPDKTIFIVVSSGIFHALGVSLYTGIPTILIDPFNNKITDMSKLSNKYRSLIAWNIYRASNYQRFAVIVVKDSHQPFIGGLPHILRILKKHNLKYSIYHSERIDENLINLIPKNEIPVIAGCPRIAIDDLTRFNRPVLNFEQLLILLGLKDFNEVYPPLK